MSAGNSAYSPLPQSNSDSDGSSEEELHLSQGNRIVNRSSKVLNSKGERVHNEQKNIVINYKPLDIDGDGIALSKKFNPSPEEVSIVKPDGGLEIFSSSRKICFVFSLLLCVFTTVAFIWILPCNVGSCFDVSAKSKNFTWEEVISNLEIYGPISLVPDQKSNHNLVFLTKSSEKNDSKNGMRCIKGKDGALKWETEFDEEPTDVDCNLIDVDADRLNDCLIYGQSFLKSTNPLSGNELWDIQKANKKEYKLYFEDFPVVLPDLNQDNVKELLLSCSLVSDGRETFLNYLVIISGKNGEIINKPLQISGCSSIHNLMFEKKFILSYTCFLSNEKESFQNISLTELIKSLKNTSHDKFNFHEGKMLNQHRKDSDVVYVNGFKLHLKNQGKCPEACDVLVDVKDERERSSSKIVYSFKKKNSFGMAPVVLKTKKETGFILKFWIWHSKMENLDFKDETEFSTQKTIILRNNTKNIKKRGEKCSHRLTTSAILDKEMLLESEWDEQRVRRTPAELKQRNKFRRSVFNLHVITETIVKISLNDSRLHVTNHFEDEIIQMCTAQICHPNPYKQRHSVLVGQLNEDEEAKLITFTSKYVHEKEKTSHKSETWQLQSTIRVLSL